MNNSSLQKPQTAGEVIQERPPPTMGQVKTFAQAILTGKYVVPEVVAVRLEICRRCEKRRVTPTGIEWCGICGCKVGDKSRQLDNLAAYEENLPKWGCKHPLRRQGKGWPLSSLRKHKDPASGQSLALARKPATEVLASSGTRR